MISPLAKARKKAGLTQAELARSSNTSQPHVRRLENDERKLTKEWAERFAPHVHEHAEDLVFGTFTVPIVGKVGAAAEAHYHADAGGFLGLAKRPRGGNERTVAVEVDGDSLGAGIDGWIVYYDNRREPPTDDMIGKLCVVCLDSGQVFVKMLYNAKAEGHFDLFPVAIGKPLLNQSIEWAARVISMMPPDLAKVEESQERQPEIEEVPRRKRAAKHRKRR
jgi:transcriptional regulator with XRE-family HTH domain